MRFGIYVRVLAWFRLSSKSDLHRIMTAGRPVNVCKVRRTKRQAPNQTDGNFEKDVIISLDKQKHLRIKLASPEWLHRDPVPQSNISTLVASLPTFSPFF